MVQDGGFILWRLFLPRQGSSALNSVLLVLRKRGVWPAIEVVKVCVWVLVGGCLRRVGRVFGGCWAVWRRCVFRACEGFWWCAEWVEKA